MSVRVLVVDDNAVIRMGLTSLLEASGEVEVVGEAGDGRTAIELAQRLHPDVVLLDVRMPLLDGVSAAGPLSEVSKVLMLTYAEDPAIIDDALRAGARGYLVHGLFRPAELVSAVTGTAAGGSFLSPPAATALLAAVRSRHPSERDRATAGLSEREAEVMDLIARGRSNSAIASTLFLSEKTVKNHVNRIYAKLGVSNRGEAIADWLGSADAPTTRP